MQEWLRTVLLPVSIRLTRVRTRSRGVKVEWTTSQKHAQVSLDLLERTRTD